MATSLFDLQAPRYDAWYDTPRGRQIFAEEIDALRPLLAELPHPWLEVGVGTGRVAMALGVELGVDVAPGALALAAGRGSRAVRARAEQLPFATASVGALLLVLTLCFVRDPAAALREARRVVRPGGGVVLGLVLAEGPWGQHYQRLGEQGHPYYGAAHFSSRGELAGLLAAAGLRPVRVRSALFWAPTAEPAPEPPREGDDLAAGFTAVLATASAGVEVSERSAGLLSAPRTPGSSDGREHRPGPRGAATPSPGAGQRPYSDATTVWSTTSATPGTRLATSAA